MKVGIIDLGISNVKSVQNMLKKTGTDSIISGQASELSKCDKLILPGIGSFDSGMKKLEEKSLTNFIKDYTQDQSKEILGICLGMQLLTKGSQEGQSEGLGLVDGEALKFQFASTPTLENLKIPNMGWRETFSTKPHHLVRGITDWRFYYVHSYFVKCNNPEDILLTSFHGSSFTSAFAHGNVYGMQFHPEKSHRYGLQILKNFCENNRNHS